MNCANHLDREKTAFCQNCGKPLCQECTRTIGPAVYCEPCLAAKLAGVQPAAGTEAYSYNDPASGINVNGTKAGGGTYSYNDPASGMYTAGTIAPQMPSAPNPALAGFLGFIPGVGAMYNEQYAKGVVHLLVFAALVTLTDSHTIFLIFVFGWEFYMAFEAFHTARCRRDGLPLPNPFGLNDLGHKLGFDKSFHGSAPAYGAVTPDPYAAPFGASAPGVPPTYPPPYSSPYPPSDPQAYARAYGIPNPQPFTAGAVPPNWGVPPTPGWEQYAAPVQPPPVPLDAQVPYPGNRFPAGAIWLIGLGAIFLLFNAGFMHGFSGRLFVPILLIGLAVFIFIRKLTDYGYGLTNDGTLAYRIRVFRALRGSVWLALVGLLFFLDDFNILSWGHSWPLFIILAGVMTVLQRAVYSSAARVAPPYAPTYGYPPQQPPPPVPPVVSSGIVPTSSHDQEGS